jgi:hypothetical protein
VGRGTVERGVPTRAQGERCIHHIYKDVADIPAEAYERIGKQKPERAGEGDT